MNNEKMPICQEKSTAGNGSGTIPSSNPTCPGNESNSSSSADECFLSNSERVILGILRRKNRRMTTKEVTDEARKETIQCPDSTPAFLSRLRMKKKIGGVYNPETKSFTWWADQDLSRSD